jgi:hypothetical protein
MSGPGQPHNPSNPMIESAQAQQIIEVLSALVDVLGQEHPASIVLQQARSEIVSLALSAAPEVPAKTRRRRAA